MLMCESVSVQEVEGKVVSLSDIRKVRTAKEFLDVSQAVFLIKTPSGTEKVQMFFWESDASQIHRLVLGNCYQFSAALNGLGNKLSLFFIPKKTVFTLLKDSGEGLQC
jgi:hypothetical protein